MLCCADTSTVKVDMKECKIIIDQELNDVTPESLQDELPDAVPRYIVYMYKFLYVVLFDSFKVTSTCTVMAVLLILYASFTTLLLSSSLKLP